MNIQGRDKRNERREEYEKREEYERRHEGKDKEESFSLFKLKSVIEKSNKILRYYSEEGYYKFIEVVSNTDGEKIFIYIPSKYPVKIDPDIPYTEINIISSDDDIDIKPTSKELESYTEIKIDGLESPPNLFLDTEEADNLVQYKTINLNTIDSVKEYIKDANSQLERFKLCTTGVKYKFGILTSSVLSIINRHNEVNHFYIKSPLKNVYKELCIVIDLENYYNKIDSSSPEIRKIYISFFSILINFSASRSGTSKGS